MPENKIEGFKEALESKQTDEQIKDLFFEIAKESSNNNLDYNMQVIIGLLECHRPNLLYEIFKKVMQIYVEKIIA